jgi:hypothetical protein
MSNTKNLPTISELITDVDLAWKNDNLNLLLSQQPPPAWIKQHPFIKGYNYLPIDKVEYLLRKIFKQYRIEVLKTGMLLNAIEVTVRVHFVHPITNEWLFYDGVGAQELQTQKDTGNLKLDMSNVNRGAVTMALPIAKTVAIKDACDHFGDIFGSNLNRKDVIVFQVDETLDKANLPNDLDWVNLKQIFEDKKDKVDANQFDRLKKVVDTKELKSYKNTLNYLNGL